MVQVLFWRMAIKTSNSPKSSPLKNYQLHTVLVIIINYYVPVWSVQFSTILTDPSTPKPIEPVNARTNPNLFLYWEELVYTPTLATPINMAADMEPNRNTYLSGL